MKSLFLAWQAPKERTWFPIGRLDADAQSHRYLFAYTKGALKAQDEVGFTALLAFPDLTRSYESSELFPLFQNRVLDPKRKDFAEYLQSLGMVKPDPIEMLALTGGERQTDSLEVFPKIAKEPDGTFVCRFFIHGLRYIPESAQARGLALQEGEDLGVSVELNNPKTGLAIQLTSRDYHFIGWTPHYLVEDLLRVISDRPAIKARVMRVNRDRVPVNRRVLVEFSGRFPEGVEPMSSEPFQLVGSGEGRH
jgi:hypothetical protein